MALRKRKPTSPARRFMSVSDFKEITSTTPEKSLLEPSPKSGGRNSYGRKTSRHRGGGHKQQYRVIDFKRNKDGVPGQGRDDRIRPQPQLPHRAAALRGRREALHPRPEEPDCRRHAAERPGRRDPRRQRPADALHPGRYRHPQRRALPGRRRQDGPLGWLERAARGQGRRVRNAASSVSSEMRRVPIDCRATVGEVGNSEFELIKVGKAGRSRWMGKRPQTRGVAMNPVDHPHGGGEGKTSGGRHPVSPWGKPEGRTRARRKDSDSMIIRRRRGRGARR